MLPYHQLRLGASGVGKKTSRFCRRRGTADPDTDFHFRADIRTAGRAVLLVSIPTVCMGPFRYGLMGLLPSQWTLLRVGVPMGIESLVGAAAGVAFAGSTSAKVLKFLLGLVLIAAALKAFWRQR
jgi:uncharacterized protein